MRLASELLGEFLRLRLDTVGFTVVSVAGAAYFRRAVRRHEAEADFSRATWPLLALLVVVGALLAEWAQHAIAFPASTPLVSRFSARLVMLGCTTMFGLVLLASSSLSAVMRAEIRRHATTAQQLERAKKAADDASRAKSDFLAVMSHEIRTPLNAVMGFANLLGETKLDDAQRDYVGTINAEGRRLTSLISDILDLTKIEEGRLVLERLPFAPVETANEVLRLLSPRALERRIDLRFEAQTAGPLLIAGDPLRFRQILLNLVDNAIKFTPQGAVTLFLAWTPPDPGAMHGRLRVQVRDTGIGIAPEKLRDLFQMFMQADTSTTRRYGGTGLGLAICQRLVSLMEGEIEVRSEPGAGAEFSFTLPVTPVAAPEEDQADPMVAVAALPRRPVILVVDDMDTNRFLLEVFLQRNGFQPELAASGGEAVQLATTRRYDAILMDLQMPDIDGFEATHRIRAQETGARRTPIIALTASIAKGTREKCLAAGMDEYLTKPLDLRRFKGLLNQLLGGAPTETRDGFAAQP